MTSPLVLPGAGFGTPRRRSNLLFHWRAADLSLRALTGQQGTFARASRGSSLDSQGTLYSVPHSAPRWTWINGAPALLMEDLRTNLMLRSQDMNNATWSKTNITVTTDQAVAPDGTLTADKVAATASGATVFAQGVAATATSHAVSCYVKMGSGATDANVFVLYNTSTSTNLSAATLNYATGVLTVTLGTGYVQSFANGWYRVTLYASAGITIGNTITGYVGFIGNSETAGEYCYAWGAQMESGSFSSSYIPTTAASVARAADALAFPFNALPQPLTVYVKAVNLGTAQITNGNNPYYVRIGVGPNYAILYENSSGKPGLSYAHTGSSVVGSVGANPVIGDTVELMGTISALGAGDIAQSLNGGAVTTSAGPGTAIGFPAAWGVQTVGFSQGDVGNGFLAYHGVKIASGVRTMDQMRAVY